MTEQSNTDATATYVLDEETVEELDGASLTSIVNDLTNTMKRPQIDVDELESDETAAETREDSGSTAEPEDSEPPVGD